MCFVDPPYNVPIAGFVSGKGRVQHRDFVQGVGELSADQFTAFLTNSLAALQRAATDAALIYACMDWRHLYELLAAGRQCGLELFNLCVWAKTNAGMGSLYRSQHELVCVFKAGTANHSNNVELGRHGRNRSNLWTYRGLNSFGADRNDLLASHPTVKPVLMIADAIRDVTKRGDAVLDTFLGSGSTLMAAASGSISTPSMSMWPSGAGNGRRAAMPCTPRPANASTIKPMKSRVRAAAEGAKIHVAIDSVGGRLLGEVADLLAEGTGTVINFGSLGGETSDIRLFPPRSLTLKGVVLDSWMQQPPEQRRADIALARRLAQEGGTLFEVAERYSPSRIADAVTHVSQAGRTGVVLINFSND